MNALIPAITALVVALTGLLTVILHMLSPAHRANRRKTANQADPNNRPRRRQ